MKVLTYLPKNMSHRGRIYYPAGSPEKTDTSGIYHHIEYRDENNDIYSIVYTQKQVENIVKENKIFSPYIPLHISQI